MLLGPLALDLMTERWRCLWCWNWPSEHRGDGDLPGPAGILVLSTGIATAIWTVGHL